MKASAHCTRCAAKGKLGTGVMQGCSASQAGRWCAWMLKHPCPRGLQREAGPLAQSRAMQRRALQYSCTSTHACCVQHDQEWLKRGRANITRVVLFLAPEGILVCITRWGKTSSGLVAHKNTFWGKKRDSSASGRFSHVKLYNGSLTLLQHPPAQKGPFAESGASCRGQGPLTGTH